MDIIEAKRVAAIFCSVHTSASVRLARGARERKRIMELLKEGKDVDSYRLDWLRAATTDLVKKLSYIAQDFNDSYHFDQCSVTDLIDLLEYAAAKLRRE